MGMGISNGHTGCLALPSASGLDAAQWNAMKQQRKPIGKGRKIVGYILLALCAAFLLYCAAVMIYRFATVVPAKRMSAFTRFMGEFGILCLLAVPAVDVRFGLFTWLKNRAARVAGIVLRALSCAICAIFVALAAAVVITGSITDKTPVQNVCLLGLAIQGEELPQDLVYRLDRALEYHAEHPEVTFIATGGNSDDPTKTEAAQMVRYLEAHGFDTSDGKLIAEPQAKTTVENFKYAAEYLDKTQPLGVVSSNVHLFRATHIAKKQGYTTLVKIPAQSVPALYPENVMWEAICCVFETMMGHMAY